MTLRESEPDKQKPADSRTQRLFDEIDAFLRDEEWPTLPPKQPPKNFSNSDFADAVLRRAIEESL